jgi:hypothetical protein
MTNERLSGLALIVASAATLLVMGLHPTGADVLAPGGTHALPVSVGVHWLALASMPLLFVGSVGMSRRLSLADPLVITALVIESFALVAVMNAAIMSGIVNTGIARAIMAAGPDASAGWRLLFNYTGQLNQGFAQVFVVGSSVAIGLWSIAAIRSHTFARVIGIYGCILAPATILAVLAGGLALDVHGFGLIVLAQAIWFCSVGARLYRFSAA